MKYIGSIGKRGRYEGYLQFNFKKKNNFYILYRSLNEIETEIFNTEKELNDLKGILRVLANLRTLEANGDKETADQISLNDLLQNM